jgi:hypothetical protein
MPPLPLTLRISKCDRQLPQLLHQLDAARAAAENQPETFQQHVGRQFSPVCEELYEPVSRRELLEVIDTLINAVSNAQRRGDNAYFFGYYGAA